MNKNQFLETDEMEIDLAELFRVLLRKWWLIAVTALLATAIAIGITKFAITPKYQSQAMIYILTKTTSVTSMVDLQIGEAITGDFEIIATSKPVIDAAIEEIKRTENVTFTRKDIKEMLTITNEDDTRILMIRAIHENPEYACWVANAIADATSERMAEIMKSDPPTTVERAEVENVPVSPSLLKNAVIGFMLGAIAICGLLLVQFIMDDTIKTEDDIERYLGESTLVMIPNIKSKRDKAGKDKGVQRGKKA